MRALYGTIELGYEMKRLAELEQALQAYLEMHPGDLDFCYALAGCLYAQNRLEPARHEVEKIVLFKPDHARALELKQKIEERAATQRW